MIHLPRACRDKTAVRFPANSFHMCCVELAPYRLLCTHLGGKGFSSFINLTALPRCRAPVRAKQLSVAATAREIWLIACMRYWPGRRLLYRCPLLSVCTIFNEIELSWIIFQQLLYFMTFLNKFNSARVYTLLISLGAILNFYLWRHSRKDFSRNLWVLTRVTVPRQDERQSQAIALLHSFPV